MDTVYKAIRAFSKLPGVGKRTAFRLVEFLLDREGRAAEFAEAMRGLSGLSRCSRCGVFKEGSRCWNCDEGDETRELFVVSGFADLLNLLSAKEGMLFFRFGRAPRPA